MEKMHIFTPFAGIEKVMFGMDRNTIRGVMNESYKTFTRGFATNTTDFYTDSGLFIEYDNNHLCNAIEFANYSNLFYNAQNLLDLKYSELIALYNNLSSNKFHEEDTSVVFYDLGFGAGKETGTNTIETIIIFSKDYWQ